MNEQHAVSVIVPIYNTSKYLAKCLDSIISQTLHNLEIICVNDGSTDNSLDILKEYATKDNRIKIINKENGGQISARKAGVAEAAGEYIGFVDSDDWIEPVMYERLHNVAKLNNVDFVSTDYIQDGNYSAVSRDAVDEGAYRGERMTALRNCMILNLAKHDKGISGSLCTKLFRSELLKKIISHIPNEVTVSEDKITTVTFLLECNSAVILHEAYYHYVIHNNSMFHGTNPNYLLNLHHVYQYMRTLYNHPNFTATMRLQTELYITQFLIKGVNTILGFSFENLFWIDPYWLKEIPIGSKIVLYGGGALGRKYYKHILADGKHEFVGCVDFNFDKIKKEVFPIKSPDTLVNADYDFIVITIKDKVFSHEIKERLVSLSVPSEKIKWFKQEELFWKFAEADGLLKD